LSSQTSHPAGEVPFDVARVIEVMAGFPGDWCLCGGWAVDAWLGRQTREHQDVDIAVFEDDLANVRRHFAGWQLWAHDENDPDSETQWEGRRLALPAHIHARRGIVNLDIQVTAREAGRWVLSTQPRVELDLDVAVGESKWGVATLAPQAVLFYKTLESRPQDVADMGSLMPFLTAAQAGWLGDAVEAARAGSDGSSL
jgi:hypothetical protein